MTLEHAIALIRAQLGNMGTLYHKPVFDEWAILAVAGTKGRILAYEGPRHAEFSRSLATDLQAFGPELLEGACQAGDYEFSPHATGPQFDAFLTLAPRVFLICSNTNQSMTGITQDPLWRKAQVPFVELSEQFRADPLATGS